MASSGSFNTTSYEGRYLKFSWEVTSQSNNSSTISWKLVGAGTGQSGYYTSGNFKVVINGKTVYSSSTRINLYNGTEVASGTATIAHNTDGTKTFSASAEAGIYYVAVNCKGSGSWSLPAIASKPTITSAPNLTNLMSSFKVSFSNPSKSALTVGVWLGSTDLAQTVVAAGSSTTSVTFTMTAAMKSALIAAAGGNSVGNTCNVKFTVTDLYDNEDTENRTFTVLADGSGDDGGGDSGGVTYDVSFSPTVVDTNSTTIALTGNSNTLVKYHSNAEYTVGASTTSGVVIEDSWQSCTNSGQTVYGSTGTITGVWDNEFRFMVQSSFIGTHMTTLTKSMVEYVKLTCSVSAGNPDTNGNVTISINGNYFNGSFGAKSNTLTLQYRYKSTTSSYSSWITITPTKSGNRYYANATITGLDYQSTYTIEAQAVDLLETATGSTMDVSAKPVFSWSGEDFKFDVPVYADKIVIGRDVNNDAIYGTTSSGLEIPQFIPCDSIDNVCRIGHGGCDNSIGSTYIAGNDILLESNKGLSFISTGTDSVSISSGGNMFLSGDTVYLGNSSTTDIYGGGYNILGAMRAMTTSYQLTPYVVGGANYSSVSTTAYLLGNNISGYMKATRSSNYTDGNISPNETVMTVQIPHGGKIKTAYATSFNTGDTGPVCSFHISSLSITSTHINFNIVLDASSASGSSLAGYWCMPIVLNLDAY